MPDIGFHRDQEMSNSLRVSQHLAKAVTAKMPGGENPIGNDRMTIAAQHQRLIDVGDTQLGKKSFSSGLVEYDLRDVDAINGVLANNADAHLGIILRNIAL